MDGAKHTETTPTLRLPLGVDPPPATDGRLRMTTVLVLLAVVSMLPLPMPLWQRAVLAVVAVAGLIRVALALRAQKARPNLGEIVLDDLHVERRSRRGTTELASFKSPFGLAVFADPRRTRVILAFTTPTSARYLTARLGDEVEGAAHADRALLSRAAAVAESDALGAQLDEATLSSTDAEALLAFVEKRSPEATERIYVSGPAGEPIVLERRALKVGAKVFDLTAPLEWKAFMFHETVGAMAMLYHATWVRQDLSEVVLVSPMPPEVSSLFADGPDEVRAVVERSSEMQRAVARDLRVMQAAADAPPPVETRIAVERMFMFPLRRALDTAPRARVSVPPFRTAPRERNLAK